MCMVGKSIQSACLFKIESASSSSSIPAVMCCMFTCLDTLLHISHRVMLGLLRFMGENPLLIMFCYPAAPMMTKSESNTQSYCNKSYSSSLLCMDFEF